VDSPVSGLDPLAGCCECGDEPLGSGDTELVLQDSTKRYWKTNRVCLSDEAHFILMFISISKVSDLGPQNIEGLS
jgi:hypothetical protein